ncbi:hypothetical protein VN97_g5515 [Penicillium thymicola]|uniref:Uncharacterized protein n=1 Tax=Penicillium thymicola TaxID=293382 RepID=A0AAI9TIR5_PENTH|nr:hypothetical protein VN97_g5515 [Penicillium thymicola]
MLYICVLTTSKVRINHNHTYDHRVWKTGLPVRSAVPKPRTKRANSQCSLSFKTAHSKEDTDGKPEEERESNATVFAVTAKKEEGEKKKRERRLQSCHIGSGDTGPNRYSRGYPKEA